MTVTVADIGAARVVTWDRQARRNAWDLPTMTAIAAEIEVAGRDVDVRMIAVRGAGGHFSAGDDLQAAIEADTAAWAETIEAFQRMTRVVLAAPVPVVAVVDGVCVGGALEFAASCDLRLCSNRVRLLTRPALHSHYREKSGRTRTRPPQSGVLRSANSLSAARASGSSNRRTQ